MQHEGAKGHAASQTAVKRDTFQNCDEEFQDYPAAVCKTETLMYLNVLALFFSHLFTAV